MESFANRLNEALKANKMKAAELARLMNLPEGTISNYRTGRYEPMEARRKEIADILDVNEQWLLGLDVPMRGTQVTFDDTNDEEKALIYAFREASERDKRLVLAVLEYYM